MQLIFPVIQSKSNLFLVQKISDHDLRFFSAGICQPFANDLDAQEAQELSVGQEAQVRTASEGISIFQVPSLDPLRVETSSQSF